MKKILPWLIGGVAAFYILSKTLLAKKLNFSLAGAKFVGKGLNIGIEIKLNVQNPANVGATINSISADIIANNNIIANVSSFEKQRIPARAETQIKILARPSIVGAASLLFDIFKKRATTKTPIILTGNVNADGVVFPLNLKYQL